MSGILQNHVFLAPKATFFCFTNLSSLCNKTKPQICPVWHLLSQPIHIPISMAKIEEGSDVESMDEDSASDYEAASSSKKVGLLSEFKVRAQLCDCRHILAVG